MSTNTRTNCPTKLYTVNIPTIKMLKSKQTYPVSKNKLNTTINVNYDAINPINPQLPKSKTFTSEANSITNPSNNKFPPQQRSLTIHNLGIKSESPACTRQPKGKSNPKAKNHQLAKNSFPDAHFASLTPIEIINHKHSNYQGTIKATLTPQRINHSITINARQNNHIHMKYCGYYIINNSSQFHTINKMRKTETLHPPETHYKIPATQKQSLQLNLNYTNQIPQATTSPKLASTNETITQYKNPPNPRSQLNLTPVHYSHPTPNPTQAAVLRKTKNLANPKVTQPPVFSTTNQRHSLTNSKITGTTKYSPKPAKFPLTNRGENKLHTYQYYDKLSKTSRTSQTNSRLKYGRRHSTANIIDSYPKSKTLPRSALHARKSTVKDPSDHMQIATSQSLEIQNQPQSTGCTWNNKHPHKFRKPKTIKIPLTNRGENKLHTYQYYDKLSKTSRTSQTNSRLKYGRRHSTANIINSYPKSKTPPRSALHARKSTVKDPSDHTQIATSQSLEIQNQQNT
eukprot:gene2625-1623_t